MKKLLFILTISFVISCGKDETPATVNCKLSKTVTVRSSYTDTSVYSYTGEDYTSVTKYSNTATIYSRKYIKSGGQYTIEFFTDNVKSHEGFGTLTAQGKFDTSRITNVTTTLFNNRDKNYYDVNGTKIRSISNYNSYINDVKYHFIAGNYSYWIYDIFYPLDPPSNRKDSVVFEYYLDKPKVAEKFAFESKYGNPEKNLVKKRLTYNLLNANILTRTLEYQYLTDADGLITREIVVSRNQPGNVFSYTDTIYYEYICD